MSMFLTVYDSYGEKMIKCRKCGKKVKILGKDFVQTVNYNYYCIDCLDDLEELLSEKNIGEKNGRDKIF